MSIILIAMAVAVQPPAVPPQVQIIREGDVYVMRTLDGAKPIYTFDRDEPGKSNCLDRCITAWPAVAAPAGARPVARWTIIARADGVMQWAFDARPVYTFVRDSAGTASGDGMGGVWHLLPVTPTR